MERLTIEELIEHCDRQMNRLPSGNKFYQEHESVRAYLQILRHYIATGLTPDEIERILDAYGRGMTLRTENAERLRLVKDISTDRLIELSQAEKDGRLVVLPEGVTVRRLYEEYRKAKHMADERLPSPDHTTGRIAGFGAGVVYILGKILACEEAGAAVERREEGSNADPAD